MFNSLQLSSPTVPSKVVYYFKVIGSDGKHVGYVACSSGLKHAEAKLYVEVDIKLGDGIILKTRNISYQHNEYRREYAYICNPITLTMETSTFEQLVESAPSLRFIPEAEYTKSTRP